MSSENNSLKSNRGRPKSTIPKDDWHVSIEQDVSIYWRVRGTDPFTGQVQKGFLSELATRLLREEMNRELELQKGAAK